jgi:hypothetical protein
MKTRFLSSEAHWDSLLEQSYHKTWRDLGCINTGVTFGTRKTGSGPAAHSPDHRQNNETLACRIWKGFLEMDTVNHPQRKEIKALYREWLLQGLLFSQWSSCCWTWDPGVCPVMHLLCPSLSLADQNISVWTCKAGVLSSSPGDCSTHWSSEARHERVQVLQFYTGQLSFSRRRTKMRTALKNHQGREAEMTETFDSEERWPRRRRRWKNPINKAASLSLWFFCLNDTGQKEKKKGKARPVRAGYNTEKPRTHPSTGYVEHC